MTPPHQSLRSGAARRAATVALGVLALAASVPWGRGQDPAADVTVQQVHFWSTTEGRLLNHGPFACWLRVRNDSPTRAHLLVFQGRDGGGLVVERRLLLPPASQHLVPWVLPLAMYHGQAEFEVDGSRLPREFEWAADGSYRGGSGPPVLLVSRRLPFDTLQTRLNRDPGEAPEEESAVAEESTPAEGATGPAAAPGTDATDAETGLPTGGPVVRMGGIMMPGAPERPRVTLARAELEAEAWPTDWQFYAGFDGVALSAAEYGALPAEAAMALQRYAECGGVVLVLGPCPAPAGWERYPPVEDQGLQKRPVGLGSWVGVPVSGSAVVADERIVPLRGLLTESMMTHAGVASAVADRPVIGKVTLPLRGTAAIIILFALMAGPVNLWFVIRRNRRLWLLWTTPLLGALFSLAIVAYFLVGEGVQAKARLRVITLLNEPLRQAVTVGIEGLYCPLPPRGGVRYDAEWQVTTATGGRPQARDLDLTAGLHFRRGWVRSRLPVNFGLRANRHAAERLPLRRVGDRVAAVNGLGAPIERLLVADTGARLWEGRDVAEGAEAILEPATQPPPKAPSVLHLDDVQRWLAAEAPPAGPGQPAAVPGLPAPGGYVAVLRRSAFLKPVLPDASYEQTAVVFGVSAAPLDGPAPAAGAGTPASQRAE